MKMGHLNRLTGTTRIHRGIPSCWPYPHTTVCICITGAQIDYHNAEYARYNNGIGAFSSVYAEYADWYNRTHTPKQNNAIHL